ncbi:MAG: hypothetical protein SO294_01370 [Prevotella sp.]|nr:hypothetical protein [Prevotella sp.]
MEKVPHFEDLPIMTANLVISVRELTKRISDLEKKIVSLDPEQQCSSAIFFAVYLLLRNRRGKTLVFKRGMKASAFAFIGK